VAPPIEWVSVYTSPVYSLVLTVMVRVSSVRAMVSVSVRIRVRFSFSDRVGIGLSDVQ